jgi:two-component system cell cycle sensor histidine kinase/response regulator CckA
LAGTHIEGSRTDPRGIFEQFIELAPNAIVGVGPDGRVVLVNAQTESLFGYERGELVGERVELLIPERFREVYPVDRDGPLADPLHTMGADLELFGRRKDGSEFPAEVILSSLETRSGLLVVAAIRDITERRAADWARMYLAAIVDSSEDAIFGKSLTGTIVSWNKGAERLYGYTAEEVVGEPASVLVPPDRADETDAILGRVAAEQVVEPYETVRLHKDGRRLTVSLTASPIRDGAGGIVGAATIGRDIMAEKAAQRKFEQFVECAPDAIVGVGRDGRIVLVNAQTEALFGYDRNELMGLDVDVLVPERFGDVHPTHRDRYFADPIARAMGAERELFSRRKDGTEFPAEISLSSIETEEGVLGIAAIRDVTDRIAADHEKDALRAQLEESRRLDAKSEKDALEAQLNQLRRLESVGQLAGGIAHDFNNILGVILSCAEFVAEEIEESSPAAEDVEEIRRAAERAAALTRQLLIFSRREVVRPEVLDLNGVVAELDRLLRRVLGEQVQLETRFAPELPPVEADPGQIEQVLVNLAVNARDAMPGGGRLLIETADVDLDEDAFPDLAAGRYVSLTVSDTGAGMDPEVAARVFEPFFSTKPKGKGTGLGLATAFGIVGDAGGSITISSEPGVGTTVKVHLPASSAAPAPAPSTQSKLAPPKGQDETVLLVEDEDGMRRVTERILVKAGYDVLSCPTGTAALAACERGDQDIDVLLTDVVMPEMLGPELVEEAIAIRPGLKVLYMSGYTHPAAAQLATPAAKEWTFLDKPFTAAALLGRVREVLDAS